MRQSYELMKKKNNARQKAHYALKTGKLTRRSCKMCCSREAEMHHGDYDKPLQVEWLCRPCHGFVHKGITRAALQNDRRAAAPNDAQAIQFHLFA